MVILHSAPFRVAGYHQLTDPQDSVHELARGLVLTVELEFERWFGGRPLRADAFVDSGADSSIISRRWIREQAEAAPPASTRRPSIDPNGLLLEPVYLCFGNLRLPLGGVDRPVWIVEQESADDSVPEMPGYEDILLGRDFIAQHRLLVVIDGERQNFSILAPVDAENRQRREQILTTLAAKNPR